MKAKIYYFLILALSIISCHKSDEVIKPKPTADFFTDDTTVYQGEYAYFSVESMNAEYFNWHFFGGIPEYCQIVYGSLSYNSVRIKYQTLGTFSVTLTVRNAYGESTISKNNFINVVEDNRPRIYGKILRNESLSIVEVYCIKPNGDIKLGSTNTVGSDNSYVVKIPDEYVGQSLTLYCEITPSEETWISYKTNTVTITITKDTHVDFS